MITGFALNHASTFLPSLTMLITLTAGTMLLVWLGELITENGIGNGVSLIIFAGIVARLPTLVSQTAQQQVAGNSVVGPVVLAFVVLLIVIGIVLIYQGERRIRVQYAKRIRGSRITQGGGSTFIPLSAGMIPAYLCGIDHALSRECGKLFSRVDQPDRADRRRCDQRPVEHARRRVDRVLYFLLVVGFAYFYTFVQFQQQNPAETCSATAASFPAYGPAGPRPST